MKTIICDICKKNEANERYRVYKTRKGVWDSLGRCRFWNSKKWQPEEKIDVCDKCMKKLFNADIHKKQFMEIAESLAYEIAKQRYPDQQEYSQERIQSILREAGIDKINIEMECD